MTRDQLDAIRARMEAAKSWRPFTGSVDDIIFGQHALKDVPALLEEVERLTAERDTFKKEAERFAKAIHTRGCQQQSAYNATCVCGADEHQRDLRTLAFRRGVAAMREAAVLASRENIGCRHVLCHSCASPASVIRALPDPEDKL